MKIVTIVGARPQFIKIAPMCRALRRAGHADLIVHTGQHYDSNMSDVFFSQLNIPHPDYNLGVGSGSHGYQTAEMLRKIEPILLKEEPDWTLVYGDTNSTLAGALAAVKLMRKVAHIEAGLRSFDRRMPEEINRVLTDHCADLLLCPSEAALGNLKAEGVHGAVELVGDIMSDSLQYIKEASHADHSIVRRLRLTPEEYLVVTVHRQENADDERHLSELLKAFSDLKTPIVFPVHPRTRCMIASMKLEVPDNVMQIDPVGYPDMVALMESAKYVLTDSGGLQKEAYWLGVPCFTLRENTEWVETIETGWNMLVGTDRRTIVDAVTHFSAPQSHPVLYGDGRVAQRCVDALVHHLEQGSNKDE
jgi:UDP-GlcNAc3NAcA epimerase